MSTKKVAVVAVATIVRLGIAELEQRLGVHRATIWRWCRDGKFPQPHFVGERRRWFLSEVEAFEQVSAARTADERLGAKNLTAGATE
jgi:predicted DNA-binding transcriptional regulator AlpA